MDRLFHVHTYRCGHAENVDEESYVKEALQMGAKTISFTDHAPFPDNPFKNRMKYEELLGYIDTLQFLKQKYRGKIDIEIGLEIEFLPIYIEYYRELQGMGCFDLLMIGQHFYQHEDGTFSFSDDKEEMKNEMFGLGDAIRQGISTGFFQVVAHPDRIFRRKKFWSDDMKTVSVQIIGAAAQNNVMLEQNLSSMTHEYQYWPQFWENLQCNSETIVGIDAHSLDDLHLIEYIGKETTGGIVCGTDKFY